MVISKGVGIVSVNGTATGLSVASFIICCSLFGLMVPLVSVFIDVLYVDKVLIVN